MICQKYLESDDRQDFDAYKDEIKTTNNCIKQVFY